MRALRDYIISLGLPAPSPQQVAGVGADAYPTYDTHGGAHEKEHVLCGAVAAAVVLGTRAIAYEASRSTDGGSIAGTVKYNGTPPAPAKIRDQRPGGLRQGGEDGSPDLDGGLRRRHRQRGRRRQGRKGKKLEPPAATRFDQKSCEFKPHVLAFPAGSTIDVLNSDGILHNIHTTGKTNRGSTRRSRSSSRNRMKIDKPEWPIEVQCDAHGWMHAYWIAQEHPYYAVTDADGDFKIGDLPAGDYEIEVWQEKLGKKTEKATIKAKVRTRRSPGRWGKS